MNDCVYHAWMQHMAYLYCNGVIESIPGMLSWEVYTLIRRGAGNGKGFTYGGIVPALVRVLSGTYGCRVEIQYRIWTPELYEADVKAGESGVKVGLEHKALHLITDMVDEGAFGVEVDRITLAPAMYLLLNSSHAVFSERVPRGGPVMALQVYRV